LKAVGGVLVRRNNSILGSGRGAVKEILVHCTTRLRPQRTNTLKCNKMKHLVSFPKRFQQLRTSP
jgi:hypothetical protein